MKNKLTDLIKTIEYDIKMCEHKSWGEGKKEKDCSQCKKRRYIIDYIKKLLQIKRLATNFVIDATGSWDTYEGERLLKLVRELNDEIEENK